MLANIVSATVRVVARTFLCLQEKPVQESTYTMRAEEILCQGRAKESLRGYIKASGENIPREKPKRCEGTWFGPCAEGGLRTPQRSFGAGSLARRLSA